MAVISVQRRPTRDSSAKATASGRTYSVKYLVVTDSQEDDASVILHAPGLPTFGAPYAFGNGADASAVLLSMTPSPHQGQETKWVVTCEYGPPNTPNKAGDGQATNPLDQWPRG